MTKPPHQTRRSALKLGAAALAMPWVVRTAAAEDKTLNVYNWADYIGYHSIAEFEHETHIKVIYGVYDSNETLEAKILAGQSGYDIVSTTTGFVSSTRYTGCAKLNRYGPATAPETLVAACPLIVRSAA